MTDVLSVYALFGSDEEARRIGRQMVEERHAACVNILGACRSFYRWEGKVEEAEEVAAIFKTGGEVARVLVDRIGALHSYEVPAVVVWRIEDTPEAYRAWVLANVKK